MLEQTNMTLQHFCKINWRFFFPYLLSCAYVLPGQVLENWLLHIRIHPASLACQLCLYNTSPCSLPSVCEELKLSRGAQTGHLQKEHSLAFLSLFEQVRVSFDFTVPWFRRNEMQSCFSSLEIRFLLQILTLSCNVLFKCLKFSLSLLFQVQVVQPTHVFS